MIKFFITQFKKIHPVIRDFFAAILLMCIIYRIIFFMASYDQALESTAIRLTMLGLGLFSDLLACLFITTVLIFCAQLFALIFSPQKTRFILNCITAALFLLLVGIYVINQKLFATLYIGLSYTNLLTYLNQPVTLANYANLLTRFDLLALLLMLSIYPIIKIMQSKLVTRIVLYGLLPIYFIIMIMSASGLMQFRQGHISNRLMTLYNSPLIQLANSYRDTFNKYNAANMQVSYQQQHSIQLTDDDFINTKIKPAIATHPKNSQEKPWNIVIFVLESVNTKYIFAPVNHKIPMPFLQSLAAQGRWYENNYSSGNISVLGEFGIFTGLYPNPVPAHFEMQSNIQIPTIANWLGKQYDSFLISTGNSLYNANSITQSFDDFANADRIHPNADLFFNLLLDENEAKDFFLARLEKAKPPFIGVYLSGATHYPYKEYRDQHRIEKNAIFPLNRYRNNLAMVDQEIQQTVNLLKKKKLLDHTILVVVGDHGELFGEHDRYVHGQTLYQEEIKVPLLIYAPKIFKPLRIKAVTSSIDILPTLLQALDINPQQRLQGEAYNAGIFARKYVFVYGDQDDLAAIDQKNNKMIISFSGNTCQLFQLSTDADENHPLTCDNTEQEKVILKFRNYQPNVLYDYMNRH